MTDRFEHVVVGLGALGSATAWQLARRGEQVLGLEQFALGHERGASHDTSRILRHSYHTPDYVRLTHEAYADWAELEAEAGQPFVTVTGGLDLFPAGSPIQVGDYTRSMTDAGVDFSVLDPAAVADRWPQFTLPEGTVALHQERTSVVPAARGTAAMQEQARRHGAHLRDECPVSRLRPHVRGGWEVDAGGQTYRCRSLVVTADAWTAPLLAPLGIDVRLTVTQEQVTYFAPEHPADFASERFPVWIWMDDPSYYGFPAYGEPTVKAAQDCGGPVVSADSRSFDPDPGRQASLVAFMTRTIPGAGPPVRSKTCLYTLTADRDFVLDSVPGHDAAYVGLGAAHGFKFAPTFGRLLADLAVTGTAGTDVDLSRFRMDRPALSDPAVVPSWLV